VNESELDPYTAAKVHLALAADVGVGNYGQFLPWAPSVARRKNRYGSNGPYKIILSTH